MATRFDYATFKWFEFIKQEVRNEVFYSDPFFISPGGYKICIGLYPTGDCNTACACVSIEILKGPNDEILHWPFSGL